jgi:16S rRNA (cytidine1402-2'-O)-methyltransferase
LRALAEVTPGRSAAVCRELTKRFEEVVRGTLEELAARFGEPPRGEVTLVLGPAEVRRGADLDSAARAAVADLVDAGASRRSAAEVVARLTGASRNALYRESL